MWFTHFFWLIVVVAVEAVLAIFLTFVFCNLFTVSLILTILVTQAMFMLFMVKVEADKWR